MPCPQAHRQASPRAPYVKAVWGDESRRRERAARRWHPDPEQPRTRTASARPASQRGHSHGGKHTGREPSRSRTRRRHSLSSDGAATSSSEEASSCDPRVLDRVPPFTVDRSKGAVQKAPRAQPRQPQMDRYRRAGRGRAASGRDGDSVSIDLATANPGKREGRTRRHSGEVGGRHLQNAHPAMKPGPDCRDEHGSSRQRTGGTSRDRRHHVRRRSRNRNRHGEYRGKADASRSVQHGSSNGPSPRRESPDMADEQ